MEPNRPRTGRPRQIPVDAKWYNRSFNLDESEAEEFDRLRGRLSTRKFIKILIQAWKLRKSVNG